MRHIPVRVGPMALLLTVISICMTTLGVLAFTTARADWNLAEKYAATVRTRYELEELGQTFLRDVREYTESGAELGGFAGLEPAEDGSYLWSAQREGFTLTVGIAPREDTGFQVTGWTIQKAWEPEEGMGELWLGD